MGESSKYEELLSQYEEPRDGDAGSLATQRATEISEKPRSGRKSHATLLVELAADVEFLVNSTDETFAVFAVDGCRQTWPVASRGFRDWLNRLFYLAHEKAPSSQAMTTAIATLAARARYAGHQAEVGLRVMEHEDAVYLDLCDADWRVVRIDADGSHIIENPPVHFIRTPGMLPLPAPSEGGSIEMLRQFLNVNSDQDFMLLVAWLIGALSPRGPYPILVLTGEQGSAKSTTARVLRALIDPNRAPIRSIAKQDRDLMIAATNTWILCFDNLSRISDWVSDALCRLATGGGFATRELYTNRSEVLLDAMRPIILNGIADPATRDDLRDRGLFVTLPPISDMDRRDEKRFFRDFERALPYILGALLDAVACAIDHISTTELPHTPRLADFARWVFAATPSLPWQGDEFLSAYKTNRRSAIQASTEDSLLATLVLELADKRNEWTGTATQLERELAQHLDERDRESRRLPKGPAAIGKELRRVAASLRQLGVDINFDFGMDRSRSRVIAITGVQRPDPTVRPVRSLQTALFADSADGADSKKPYVARNRSGRAEPHGTGLGAL